MAILHDNLREGALLHDSFEHTQFVVKVFHAKVAEM